MFKRLVASSLLFAGLIVTPLLSFAAKNEQGGMPPAVVAIAPVKVVSWQPDINAIGTLAANQGIVIRSEIQGRVTGIYFRSGDTVKAGAPLLQLNPASLQADLAAAQAKAALSQANYSRAQALYKKQVFAKAELDNALANYAADKATVAQTKAALDQAFIHAPFSGRLGLRLVNLGDYVASGQAIVSLSATNPLRVDFSVPETYINQVALGQTVLISSRTYLKSIFKGKIYAMDAMIDANTRTLGVRAVLPNQDGKLVPGAFVDVKLMTGSAQKTLFIPQTALSYEGNTLYIYKVVNGNAVKTKIMTGARKGDDIEVISGLKAGDAIIIAGQMKVMDGQPVMAGT